MCANSAFTETEQETPMLNIIARWTEVIDRNNADAQKEVADV